MGLELGGGCGKERYKVMILLQNINLPLSTDFSDIPTIVAPLLKIPKSEIKGARIYKKSVDARHKNNIVFCCAFLIEAANENKIIAKNKKASLYLKKPYEWKRAGNTQVRPIIIGFGPAGIFAALALAKAGLKPIIIERGTDVDTRQTDVNSFFSGGKLNPESNIQFGEGGAGTFSDGKLNTGIKDARISVVLETLSKFGAPDKILYDSKPHIGTDILRVVVKNIRNEIISLGGEVRFNSRLDNIEIINNQLTRIKVTSGKKSEWIACSHLVLATGHSARDTYKMLKAAGVELVRKPFSVGARIEHLQSDINRALYGDFANHPALGAADYKMAVHLPSGRGVYTFCMCPGGEVINASSEENMTCVNGMSNSVRDGVNANSALLVDIRPEDLMGDDVLAGIELQREIESRAFSPDGVPFCYVGDLIGEKVTDPQRINPTVKPKAKHTNIESVLPDFAVNSLREALPLFGQKISGFDNANAVLTFPETRSSAPVRILRNESYTATDVSGLYPCGEGAGYAGGITSAAVDGLRIAEALIDSINKH